jgi:hypothetical protein
MNATTLRSNPSQQDHRAFRIPLESVPTNTIATIGVVKQ